MRSTLFVLLLALFVSCNQKETITKPLLDYIPEDAVMIAVINDHAAFKNVLRNNEFLSELKNSKTSTQILDKVKFLEYVNPESEGILTLSKSAENHFDFLYMTKDSSNLIDLSANQNKALEPVDANSAFDAFTLDNSSFFGLRSNQKIFISSSKLLLEKVEENPSFKQPEMLSKLYSIVNKEKPASIFININKGNSLLTSIEIENSKMKISGFSDWISLDINKNSKDLNLSGISIANDSTWNYVDLLANTKPLANETALFTPAQADAILSYTFDAYATLAKNRELSTGIVSPVEPSMSTVEEIGIIYMGNQKAIVLNTFGSENISEYLMTQKKATIDFQGQEILELNKSDFLNNRFSPIVENYEARFCALLNNAFVFSTTQKLLKTIIRNYKNASTFNKTPIFKTLNKDLAKESSILFISNSKNIKRLVADNFSASFSNEIKKITLSGYGLAAQTITDKNFYHTNLIVKKVESKGAELTTNAKQVFKVDLNSEIATDPQFITNHQTGRKEIVVQDENNVLYLISDKGKVLWKKQLNSLIQGEVKQVDIFKNGRLQLAFTTNNQLMLLDRNGNEVKKFTKTYEGGNLNPLAVFDYDKKKNYRFVVTQATKTFMYDREAKIVTGFKYTSAEQPIIAAPKHIVINNKDFLVFKLKGGSLKLLNRVGDVRVKVDEKINFSDNEVFRYKNKFALTDQKGVLNQIDLGGKITKTNFNLSSDHGMTTTDNTLVLMNDNVLTIKGKQVELELGVYTEPEIFYLNNKIYVGVTDLQNEKVYLFDSQAKPIGNFPVSGSSKIDIADIDKNKTLELVTKDSNSSISVYKVN
ncbi:ribonuclease HII [Maribacter sp. 2308TA10-17]|uniref:ribonuclease HII n=1 Tax=Maribacter sp. 2308TA10-17 TaxID=3386276 RepID=UPI0039BD6670